MSASESISRVRDRIGRRLAQRATSSRGEIDIGARMAAIRLLVVEPSAGSPAAACRHR